MLPKGWRYEKLENLANVERGKFTVRPRNDPRYYGGLIPFVQTGDVASANGFLSRYSQTLNDEGLKVSKLFPKGSILVTIAANIGDVAITLIDVACPDSIVVVQSNLDVSNQWLRYALTSQKKVMDSEATQNAQKNINLQVLRPLKILTPPLLEQKKIAEILENWDEAIALTEKAITAKQKLKQVLAKKLLSGKIRFSQYQFESWKLVNLDKVSDIRRGASPRPIGDPKYFSEKGRGWIRIADVTASKTYLTETSQYLSTLGESKSVPVDPGDLIMSICATIGVPRIVKIRACIHDGFVVIRPKSSSLISFFMYYFLDFISAELARSGQPGTQKNLNTSIVSKIKIPEISVEEHFEIINILSSADEEIYKLYDYLASLKKQKQGLMQKLLTGKWRVIVESQA
jgi:type I restriction enzyme, S subunit